MNYDEWMLTIPKELTGDSLWKMEAYRLALFVSDVGWYDVTKLSRDRRMLDLSDQLYEALGSVSANLAEGYSRGTGKDRARFYEYSLGSARESRDWYFKARHVLGEEITLHRLRLLTHVIRLLLTMVPQQRGSILRDDRVEYRIDSDNAHQGETLSADELNSLLKDVPLPNL
jgi:four helix bundle protein